MQVKLSNGTATYFFRDHALVQGLFVDTSSYANSSLTYFRDVRLFVVRCLPSPLRVYSHPENVQPAVSQFVSTSNLTKPGASVIYGTANCTYKGLTLATLAECQAAIVAEDQRRNVTNEYR